MRGFNTSREALGMWNALKMLTNRYDITSTIVVAGSPRSGTTWVAEVLNTIPDSSILYEPLYLRSDPSLKEIGFKWRTFISSDSDLPGAREFIRDVLAAKILNGWTLSLVDKGHITSTKVWIVKFVRANMLLGWMVRRFPIKPPLAIVRHPCAVVASQLRMGEKHWKNPSIDYPEFFENYSQFKPVKDKVKSVEEKLALIWCIENFSVFTEPKPYPWFLVTYEELVKDSVKKFTEIFEHFGHAISSEAIKKIKKDSSTTVKDELSWHRLKSWQKYLNRDQAAAILDIVSQFGLDFYSENFEPDYERIYSNHPL